MPTVTVEVAFTTADPFTVPGSWTDISAYVRSVDIRRGRNHELGRMEAGEATVVLDNGDRRFDPVTGFPYHPNVDPGRRVRIRATYNAVTYDLFQGYAENWGQAWPGRPIQSQGDAETELRVVDGFKVLNATEIRSYHTEVLAEEPLAYWRFNNGAAYSSVPNEGSQAEVILAATGSLPTSVSGPLLGGETAVSGDSVYTNTGTTDQDAWGIRSHWTVEFWYYPSGLTRHSIVLVYRATGQDLIRVGVENRSPYVVLGSEGSSASRADANGQLTNNTWSHVAVVRDGREIRFYINGALDSTETLDLPDGGGEIYFSGISQAYQNANARLANLAVYGRSLRAASIAAHAAIGIGGVVETTVDDAITTILDAVGWASGDRTIETSLKGVSAFDPNGNALEILLRLAENTDGGLLFIKGDGDVWFRSSDSLNASPDPEATWGDTSGEINYTDLVFRYDDTDLFPRVRASAVGLPDSVAEDESSVTMYGPRTLDNDAGYLATSNELDDRANGLLARYESPSLRAESMQALGVSGTMVEMLTADVARRVTVKRRPPGSGGTVEQDVFVEGIEHRASPTEGVWETTFALAPVLDEVFWILADATYGVMDSTTVLGF